MKPAESQRNFVTENSHHRLIMTSNFLAPKLPCKKLNVAMLFVRLNSKNMLWIIVMPFNKSRRWVVKYLLRQHWTVHSIIIVINLSYCNVICWIEHCLYCRHHNNLWLSVKAIDYVHVHTWTHLPVRLFWLSTDLQPFNHYKKRHISLRFSNILPIANIAI